MNSGEFSFSNIDVTARAPHVAKFRERVQGAALTYGFENCCENIVACRVFAQLEDPQSLESVVEYAMYKGLKFDDIKFRVNSASIQELCKVLEDVRESEVKSLYPYIENGIRDGSFSSASDAYKDLCDTGLGEVFVERLFDRIQRDVVQLETK